MKNGGFYDKDKNTAYLRRYRGTGGRSGIISFDAVGPDYHGERRGMERSVG